MEVKVRRRFAYQCRDSERAPNAVGRPGKFYVFNTFPRKSAAHLYIDESYNLFGGKSFDLFIGFLYGNNVNPDDTGTKGDATIYGLDIFCYRNLGKNPILHSLTIENGESLDRYEKGTMCETESILLGLEAQLRRKLVFDEYKLTWPKAPLELLAIEEVSTN